ncbi:MAG: class C sortase [Intestinibacter bartlettii]|uniref:class C sortase n=1 Tax=Clostridia TaxID=186801 RepID=UPI0039996D7D
MGKNEILKKISFLIGLILCLYPLVSGIVEQQSQKDVVATYQQMIENSSSYSIEDTLTKADEYNRALFRSKTSVLNSEEINILSEENYNQTLNMGNGIMGSIEIPKISVNLPIYHGTSDEVLSAGVGHVNGSSLPIGGSSRKSILTGHRGLPSSKLFTRLDELELNDLFFISVLNETLAYKVVNIQVIEPEDVSSLEIEEGRDLVSLITCTPYGVNTHRLVVTGERTIYEKSVYEGINKNSMSMREVIFTIIPFGFVTIVIGMKLKERKEKKNGCKEN